MYSNFARLLVTAAIAFGAVNAAPAANVNTIELEGRAAQVDGHLFVCTDINFTGQCVNLSFNFNECINFLPPFQDTISSWGPDNGICITYVDANCSGANIRSAPPGFSSLTSDFNDKLSSFLCFHQ